MWRSLRMMRTVASSDRWLACLVLACALLLPASWGERHGFVGARVGVHPHGFYLGTEGGAFLERWLALGAHVSTSYFDHGADPQYCSDCTYGLATLHAFGEARANAEGSVTPYGRVGFGLAFVEGQRSIDEGVDDFTRPLVNTELGVDFHYWVSLRLFGSVHVIPGSYGDTWLIPVVGVQLGSLF